MNQDMQDLVNGAPQSYDPTSDEDQAQVIALADALGQDARFPDLLALEETLKAAAAPLPLQLAAKLARSKAIIRNLRAPVFVSITFAMYKEHTRILPRSEHPQGEDFLRRKLAQLRWLFDAHPASGFELIPVDDGCPEHSGKLAEQIAQTEAPDNCRVLFLEAAIKNQHPGAEGLGSTRDSQKGGSILFGMADAAARNEERLHLVIFTDADVSTHLGQVGLLVDGIVNQGLPVAIGSRREPTSVVIKQGKRNDRGKLFIYLWKRLLPLLGHVVDTQCGFKAFRADMVRAIVPGVVEKRFAFDIELLLKAELQQHPACVKVPVCWIDSEAASTTADIQPYLSMLQSVARMYRQYLPADERADHFASFLEKLDEEHWQRLLDHIPSRLTEREPASFGAWDEVSAQELKQGAGLDAFAPMRKAMQDGGCPELAIKGFRRHYEQLLSGASGLISESAIEPVPDLPHADDLGPELEDVGSAALPKTVLIKLNGGLGTSMGLRLPKSLLAVKEGCTFLDLIARQALHHGCPLVLMDSFATRGPTLEALAAYPDLKRGLPLDFLQHRVPKIVRKTLLPVEWPADPQLQWCPPGHGDLYHALVSSGLLDALEQAGMRYAFVSNSDNLGAALDTRILGYFVSRQLPFLMEVADRTEEDRKGGHLARRDGQLILRESAQCPPEDKEAFQNVERHRFFNTNSLWVDLEAVRACLRANDGLMPLPLIRNQKTVDPRDPTSTEVYQLESAMGAAIELFSGAEALRVSRRRFAPVKTTSDLLRVRSDATALTAESHVVSVKQEAMVIELDKHYKLIQDFEGCFPKGPPSLIDCASLRIEGPFRFGAGVRIEGSVTLRNDSAEAREIPDGAVLREDS